MTPARDGLAIGDDRERLERSRASAGPHPPRRSARRARRPRERSRARPGRRTRISRIPRAASDTSRSPRRASTVARSTPARIAISRRESGFSATNRSASSCASVSSPALGAARRPRRRRPSSVGLGVRPASSIAPARSRERLQASRRSAPTRRRPPGIGGRAFLGRGAGGRRSGPTAPPARRRSRAASRARAWRGTSRRRRPGRGRPQQLLEHDRVRAAERGRMTAARSARLTVRRMVSGGGAAAGRCGRGRRAPPRAGRSTAAPRPAAARPATPAAWAIAGSRWNRPTRAAASSSSAAPASRNARYRMQPGAQLGLRVGALVGQRRPRPSGARRGSSARRLDEDQLARDRDERRHVAHAGRRRASPARRDTHRRGPRAAPSGRRAGAPR